MAIKHSIALSTTEPNNEVGVIKIRQADEQTQMLDVQITENGVPKSYYGFEVFFCAKLGQTAGLGIIEQKLKPEEMTNPANGKLVYTMRAEDWQILGRQKGYFSFRKMKDEHEFVEQFTTRDFTFDVIKSVYSDGVKEVKKDGSTYVWTIEELLRLFREYIDTGKIEWGNYKESEITDWEEFVRQNRDVLESVDPGGELLGELLDARKPEEELTYESLSARLNASDRFLFELIKKTCVINAEHLAKWKAKRARMLDENIKIKMAFWGDSITEGYYASNPLTLDDKRNKSWVGLIHNYYKDIVGDVGKGYCVTMASGTTDVLSEWDWNSNEWRVIQESYTKSAIRSSTVNSSATLNFSGIGVEIQLIKARFFGEANIYIDGNFIKTIDLSASTTAQVIHNESISGLADSEHVLKIEHASGNYCGIIGALPIKGDKGVITMNFARSGDKTDRLANGEGFLENNTEVSLGLLNPDLIFICYHTNDAGHNTGINNYIQRLSSFVDAALANGSEVILVAQSAQRGMTSLSKNVMYRNAMKSVAINKGVCMVDWTGRWLFGNELTKVGKYLYDTDHYNEKGFLDIFDLILAVLE